MHKGQKKAPGQPGLARIDHERKSRDHGALDVPILSQSMNQARRGSRKRPDPPLDTTGPEGGYSKRLRMLEHQLAGWAVCARALRECLIGGKASVVSSLPRQRSMNLLQRPLPVTSQQSVPLAVANSDVATAERLFRAIVELVVGPAMIGTVIACLCDIEAAMVAKPSWQEAGLLPVDLDQKTICG